MRVNYYMHIYLITNLINNKQYIGKTKEKDPSKRTNDYIYRNFNKKDKRPIERAIKKYGISNFKIEIIHTDYNLTNEELLELETEYIKKYDCLVPKGYNVILDNKHWGNMKKIRKGSLKYTQGMKKKKGKNLYVGVYKERSGFKCEITFKKTFRKTFGNEIEAAEAYDKMAIYLYGKDCNLNFPNKREKYLNEGGLAAFYEKFNERRYKSKYNGVSWQNAKSAWRVLKRINGKTVHIKHCFYELEAAELYDKISLYLDKDFKYLNFPEKKDQYLEEDLHALYKSLAFNKEKSSKFENVFFIKDRGVYKGQFITNGERINCGTGFKTEEDANQAVLNKKIEMGLIGGEKQESPKSRTQVKKERRDEEKNKILEFIKNNNGLLNSKKISEILNMPLTKTKHLVIILRKENKIKIDLPMINSHKVLWINNETITT